MICLASAADGSRIGDLTLDVDGDNFPAIADFDGLGRAGIFVSSRWGIGILKYDAGKLIALATAANATRLGQWVLNSEANVFGPAADYDGDGVSEILVTGSSGVGILKYTNGGFTCIAMTANGTVVDGIAMDTREMSCGPVDDFDGSGRFSVLVSCPWGIAFLGIGEANAYFRPHEKWNRHRRRVEVGHHLRRVQPSRQLQRRNPRIRRCGGRRIVCFQPIACWHPLLRPGAGFGSEWSFERRMEPSDRLQHIRSDRELRR